MGKIILLALGVWLVVTILKRYASSLDTSAKPTAPEDMVRCRYCGVHLPKSEAIFTNQQYYCCEAHSKQHD